MFGFKFLMASLYTIVWTLSYFDQVPIAVYLGH